MKRIIIYVVVLLLSFIIPEYGTDVGKLIPVELVFVYKDAGEIIVETDTGAWGKGSTVNAAIRNLQETATGEVFLDTAEYLLVEGSGEDQIYEIAKYLKGSVRVCKAQKGLDLQKAAQYLNAHEPEMKLKAAKTSVIEQKLEEMEGRIKIS